MFNYFEKIIHMYLHIWQLNTVDELFNIEPRKELTQASELCVNMRSAAQDLLNHYVRMQGLSVSQVN